jgi:hypothetical protein
MRKMSRRRCVSGTRPKQLNQGSPQPFAPGLGSPCHICSGTGFNATMSAPGLRSTLPRLSQVLLFVGARNKSPAYTFRLCTFGAKLLVQKLSPAVRCLFVCLFSSFARAYPLLCAVPMQGAKNRPYPSKGYRPPPRSAVARVAAIIDAATRLQVLGTFNGRRTGCQREQQPHSAVSAVGMRRPTSAPELRSPRPHLSRDWGTFATAISAGTRLTLPTPICAGTWRYLQRGWAHPAHICWVSGPLPTALPHLRRDSAAVRSGRDRRQLVHGARSSDLLAMRQVPRYKHVPVRNRCVTYAHKPRQAISDACAARTPVGASGFPSRMQRRFQ